MNMKLWCLLLLAAASLAICSAAPAPEEPSSEVDSMEELNSVDDNYEYPSDYDYCGDDYGDE